MATILPRIWRLCIWHIQFEIRDELLLLFPEMVFPVIKFSIIYMQEAGKILKKGGKKSKAPSKYHNWANKALRVSFSKGKLEVTVRNLC